MTRIAYVNGAYRPLHDAAIAVQDRGFQFGDAVYEVWPVSHGRLIDHEGHLARLIRSLSELGIPLPLQPSALRVVLLEVLRRNRVKNGAVYLQISRGAAAQREHAPDGLTLTPTIVATAKAIPPEAVRRRSAAGVQVITVPEARWARCDIKSVNLLPNVLAKRAALRAGAAEAWFVTPSGFVSEGASSNAWIVDAAGLLRTSPLSHAILPGVTRAALLRLAQDLNIPWEERAFSLEEAKAAREAFLSSATNAATPVIAIDGAIIGDGGRGPVTAALQRAYAAERQA